MNAGSNQEMLSSSFKHCVVLLRNAFDKSVAKFR